jgi:hypothetical protein
MIFRLLASNKTRNQINVSGSGPALEGKSGSRSASKSKFYSYRGSKWNHGGPWTRSVCRPVIADFHHFDEKQAPDPLSRERKSESGSAIK